MAAISLLVVWVIGEFIHRETGGVGGGIDAPTQSTQRHMHAHTRTFSRTHYFMQEKNILTFALQNRTRASV